MNWYKTINLKIAEDFSDRNILNHKIMYLTNLKDSLEKIAKIVFQSASTAQKVSSSVVYDKKISSYPNLRDIISEANFIVLDNPWKFADLCNKAIYEIDKKLFSFKKEREEFTDSIEKKEKNKVQKGWF